MAKSSIILQELSELNSTLATTEIPNVYSVPAGYFEGLAEQVLNRLRAMEAKSAEEELGYLSPLLSGMSKQMPYSVPTGYFQSLEDGLLHAVRETAEMSAGEELSAISPLLGSLKKEMPFDVPTGYFENLSSSVSRQTTEPVRIVKVISITQRRWFRIAAAAVMAGLLVTAGFVYNGMQVKKNSFTAFTKKLNNEIQKTPDIELTEFAEILDNGQDLASNAVPKEVSGDLLKDIPANDLQSFLDETSDNENYNN